MKRVIIFGANGMIGVYLTCALADCGMEVYASGRNDKYKDYYAQKGISSIVVDITKKEDFDKLPQSGIDVVILLAAYLPANMEGYNPRKYIEVNTLGALNVLEYCRKCGVKQILYPQTHSDVAGHWGEPVIDPYACRALNYNDDHTVYAISKIAAQELINHYHEAYGLSYCIFRCPNIYAWHPSAYYYVNGERKEIAYRKLIRKAENSKDIEIWGNCHTPRDMVYIKDFIQLVQKSIEKEIVKAVYNVSTGVATTLEEEILTIVDVFSPKNKKSKIIYRPDIPIKESSHRYSIKNAVEELGYCPKYFCKEMFADMKKEKESGRFDFI